MNGKDLQQREFKAVNRLMVDICKDLRDEAGGKLRSLDELDPRDEEGEEETRDEKVKEKKKIPCAAKALLKLHWSQIHSVAIQMIEDSDGK